VLDRRTGQPLFLIAERPVPPLTLDYRSFRVRSNSPTSSSSGNVRASSEPEPTVLKALQRPFSSGNLFYLAQLKKVSAEPIIDASTLREMLLTEATGAMRSIEAVDASATKG